MLPRQLHSSLFPISDVPAYELNNLVWLQCWTSRKNWRNKSGQWWHKETSKFKAHCNKMATEHLTILLKTAEKMFLFISRCAWMLGCMSEWGDFRLIKLLVTGPCLILMLVAKTDFWSEESPTWSHPINILLTTHQKSQIRLLQIR